VAGDQDRGDVVTLVKGVGETVNFGITIELLAPRPPPRPNFPAL
jgi:hypothetical protein